MQTGGRPSCTPVNFTPTWVWWFMLTEMNLCFVQSSTRAWIPRNLSRRNISGDCFLEGFKVSWGYRLSWNRWIEDGFTLNVTGLEIARFAHAAVHPRPGSWNGENVNIYTSMCMENAYARRNMSQLWECWTDVSIRNTKLKSGDVGVGGVCPFFGVHDACLRCNCRKELSGRWVITFEVCLHFWYVHWFRCRLLHLNNVYFKPKMVEERGNLVFRPFQSMVELWKW